MTQIQTNLLSVRRRMAAAAQSALRSPEAVCLLAVSKKQPADAIREAYALGQRDFGENYVQEGMDKQKQLSDLSICWHFIGPLQRNKTREVAENFQWVHSVDRLIVAERLSAQRPDHLPPLQVCLQVNVDDEDSKSGCASDEVEALAKAVAGLPRLTLRGLMCIPKPGNTAAFTELAKTLQQIQATISGLDTLSMGMSEDLEPAIAAGATWVRIGTALFGARQ